MQRFTNLDRAEEQSADVNELLKDTIGLLQSELNQRAEVTLNLKPLPRLKCKPQQLSAVFFCTCFEMQSLISKKTARSVLAASNPVLKSQFKCATAVRA